LTIGALKRRLYAFPVFDFRRMAGSAVVCRFRREVAEGNAQSDRK